MADSQLAKMRGARRQPPPRRSPGSVLEVFRDALGGYLNRQGRYANEGLALADQGAGELQNANPWGALNMPLGALGYLTSPINALLPGGDEIDATNLSPEAKRLLTAGTAGMMAVMPGGPKGPKGLGRGLGSLADDATDAERAALAGRLEAEATQTGGQAVTTSRDQALRNLTEAPGDSWLRASNPMELRTEGLRILNKIRPLEAALKKAIQNGDASQVSHIREKLKPLQEQLAPLRDYVRPPE